MIDYDEVEREGYACGTGKPSASRVRWLKSLAAARASAVIMECLGVEPLERLCEYIINLFPLCYCCTALNGLCCGATVPLSVSFCPSSSLAFVFSLLPCLCRSSSSSEKKGVRAGWSEDEMTRSILLSCHPPSDAVAAYCLSFISSLSDHMTDALWPISPAR